MKKMTVFETLFHHWKQMLVCVCVSLAVVGCGEEDLLTGGDEPGTSGGEGGIPVEIPDANLRAALQDLLGTDDLTDENLATINTLTLQSKNYSTLEGISHLVNLDSLTIENRAGKSMIPFPEEIVNMKRLHYLRASSVFRGKLPAELSGFTYFAVGDSYLEGDIPAHLMDVDAERVHLSIVRSRFTGMPVNIWRKVCEDVEKYQLTTAFAPQAKGYFLTLYDPDSLVNTDFRNDGDFELYRQATKGNGINMFILCDGFDRSCNAVGGVAETVMKFTVDQLFSINPMNKLRDYFNVYLIYVESPDKGVGYNTDDPGSSMGSYQARTKFNTRQPSTSTRYYLCDTPGIMRYIEQTTGVAPWGGAVLLIAHNMVHGGSAGMEYADTRTSFSVSTVESAFAKTVWHESVGHSIGWLADEYVESSNGVSEVPEDTKRYRLWAYSKYDYCHNVSYTNDTTAVWWADFIGDPRFEEENISLYEGADYWAIGVWRPTENSLMRTYDRDQQFNAPCRALIYKEIMSKAIDGFTYNYEDFVQFDMQDAYYPLE